MKQFVLALSLLSLVACSGNQLAVRGKARDQLINLQYAEAEKSLQDPKVLSESKNRLLTLLELGIVAHYSGNFEKSNLFFFKAKDTYRELYTASVREAIASGVFNDTSTSYTGMEYEISLLHYYIVKNFIELSEASSTPAWQEAPLNGTDGKPVLPELAGAAKVLNARDKQDYSLKARAELLDWNSFLGEVRENNHGEPYYKDDLLNKVFAGFVHRMVGTNQDLGIATALNKDANDVLVRAYAAYPSFNESSAAYVENYKKFPDIGVDTVKQKFIQATALYKSTEAAIQAAAKKNSNTMILVEYSEVPKRVEKKYVIGLSTLFGQIKDPQLRRQVEQIGMQTILNLAPAFGLTAVAATVVGAVTDQGRPQYMSQAIDSAIGFEFKLPKIESYPATESMQLRLHPASGADILLPIALMDPVADISALNVERRANAIATKTGIRVGMKYLAALIPAILMYKKLEGSPDFVRMLAASAVWMAGKKVVDATEEADLRSWDFLPRWIGSVETKLAPGNYGMSLIAPDKEIPVGSLAIDSSLSVHPFRVFSTGKVAYP